MLKSDLVQTDKHKTNRFAISEKFPIFRWHKSYKNTLASIK
jgi:hypothetical protein